MTLQQCTKAELLWVIERACLHGMSKCHIEYALIDLEREKIQRELDKACAAMDAAQEADRKWEKLMRVQK